MPEFPVINSKRTLYHCNLNYPSTGHLCELEFQHKNGISYLDPFGTAGHWKKWRKKLQMFILIKIEKLSKITV